MFILHVAILILMASYKCTRYSQVFCKITRRLSTLAHLDELSGGYYTIVRLVESYYYLLDERD